MQRFAPIIFPYIELDVVCQIDWRETTGKMYIKCTLTLHSGISITDKVKINEQNKSIATGPLYGHSKFEAIRTLLRKFGVVEPCGVSNLVTSIPRLFKTPNYILAYRNDVV